MTQKKRGLHFVEPSEIDILTKFFEEGGGADAQAFFERFSSTVEKAKQWAELVKRTRTKEAAMQTLLEARREIINRAKEAAGSRGRSQANEAYLNKDIVVKIIHRGSGKE